MLCAVMLCVQTLCCSAESRRLYSHVPCTLMQQRHVFQTRHVPDILSETLELTQTRFVLMLRMNHVCCCGGKSVCVDVQCFGMQGCSGQCSIRDGGSEGGPRAEGEGPAHPAAGLRSSCRPDPFHQVMTAFRKKGKEKKTLRLSASI